MLMIATCSMKMEHAEAISTFTAITTELKKAHPDMAVSGC